MGRSCVHFGECYAKRSTKCASPVSLLLFRSRIRSELNLPTLPGIGPESFHTGRAQEREGVGGGG